MTTHFVRMGAAIALLVLGSSYPFLPGQFDSLAIPLSSMAQALGFVGLLVVPIGIVWLAAEWRRRQCRKRMLPLRTTGYGFALIAMLASSLVVVAVSVGVFLVFSPALSVLALALWGCIAFSLRPSLKALKERSLDHFNAAPLYLVAIPSAVVVLLLALGGSLREFSRRQAIEHSAELIADIEAYRAAHGQYPEFLQAAHKDYHPSVVGIEQFHYARHREGYNLFFERPALLSEFGLREFVVFNGRDEHVLVSHAAWILAGPPSELERRQGRPRVHDASKEHWKYFWFD